MSKWMKMRVSNIRFQSSTMQKMYIFDMAGTTVNDNGLVYKTLKDIIKTEGFLDEKEFYKFHGKKI